MVERAEPRRYKGCLIAGLSQTGVNLKGTSSSPALLHACGAQFANWRCPIPALVPLPSSIHTPAGRRGPRASAHASADPAARERVKASWAVTQAAGEEATDQRTPRMHSG